MVFAKELTTLMLRFLSWAVVLGVRSCFWVLLGYFWFILRVLLVI